MKNNMIRIELYNLDTRESIFELFFDQMPTKDQFMVAFCRYYDPDIVERYTDILMDGLKDKELPQPSKYFEICEGFPVNEESSEYYLDLYVQEIILNNTKDLN